MGSVAKNFILPLQEKIFMVEFLFLLPQSPQADEPPVAKSGEEGQREQDAQNEVNNAMRRRSLGRHSKNYIAHFRLRHTVKHGTLIRR